jgi:hypothetical protein
MFQFSLGISIRIEAEPEALAQGEAQRLGTLCCRVLMYADFGAESTGGCEM